MIKILKISLIFLLLPLFTVSCYNERISYNDLSEFVNYYHFDNAYSSSGNPDNEVILKNDSIYYYTYYGNNNKHTSIEILISLYKNDDIEILSNDNYYILLKEDNIYHIYFYNDKLSITKLLNIDIDKIKNKSNKML